MPLIEFTEEEIRVQIQLNDLAIKANGFQVAEAGVVLIKKLQAALTPPTLEVPAKPIAG